MSRLIDADVLPEISLFGTTEYINVQKAPTVQAIPLNKIKQAREEIDDLTYVESYIDPYSVIEDVLEILDKLIESEV